MKNILVVCSNGIGSSLMMKMAVKSVAEKPLIDANVTHSDLESANDLSADIYVCPSNLTPSLEAQGKTNIVSLTNIFDKADIESQLSAFI